jgi:hypothetical protein
MRHEQKHGPIYAVFLDGNFEASLLLLDDLWDKELSKFVEGHFTAALPARDVLAFSDSASVDGIIELKKIVARVVNGDHLLSSSLYHRDGHKWVQNAA